MVDSLGEAHDLGWTLWVACAHGNRDGLKSIRECRQRYRIDMSTLLWTRGRACPLARLEALMRCPRCGSRTVRVSFVPPSGRRHAG
ncbi:hypothetical protein Sa4125_41750 [Aureimonas sp. SA4125]|uniref:hypothetical protein n=1 Tax=Aureimonas sp. SA4125 TaxID=2826993 RepID=UPI001CC406A6|nr:hypothetical protein [Aureimonas sp. SA4125]BDA86633.1 hypothetical protein Sa4125_41750 [Aureimonas sp. SA4125]